jgi:hypothetical protein
MTEENSEHLTKFIESTEEEKRKNRILLGIFVAGIIGFVILLCFRPPMKNAHVFNEASFPPSAKDLYKISQVDADLDRYW